jgi:hypothetical protein
VFVFVLRSLVAAGDLGRLESCVGRTRLSGNGVRSACFSSRASFSNELSQSTPLDLPVQAYHCSFRHLFDGMSHRGKSMKASLSSSEEYLSARIPCCSMLALRWRHLWSSIPCLRITDVDAFRRVEKLNEFNGVFLEDSLLDFSSCLKISNCVVSQSLKHLSIMGCELCWRLYLLQFLFHCELSWRLYLLQVLWRWDASPFESMPLLESATVNYCDFCDRGGIGDCVRGMCLMYSDNDSTPDVSVHLVGLSTATCLELTASPKMVLRMPAVHLSLHAETSYPPHYKLNL